MKSEREVRELLVVVENDYMDTTAKIAAHSISSVLNWELIALIQDKRDLAGKMFALRQVLDEPVADYPNDAPDSMTAQQNAMVDNIRKLSSLNTQSTPRKSEEP